MEGRPDLLCLILTRSVLNAPLPTGIWLAAPYSRDAGLVCWCKIGNRRENMHVSKRHNKNGCWGLLEVGKNVCFPISFPFQSNKKVSAVTAHLLLIFFLLSSFSHVLPMFDAAWSTHILEPPDSRTWQDEQQPSSPPPNKRHPMKVPPGYTTPLLVKVGGTEITYCAPPNRFSSRSQMAIAAHAERLPVSITWRRRVCGDEVHCGCDWHWKCYLWITTNIESLYGQSSGAE